MAGRAPCQQMHQLFTTSMEPPQKVGKTERPESGMATEEKQSVGVNGNTISCLQFTGNCTEALELYKVCYLILVLLLRNFSAANGSRADQWRDIGAHAACMPSTARTASAVRRSTTSTSVCALAIDDTVCDTFVVVCCTSVL